MRRARCPQKRRRCSSARRNSGHVAGFTKCDPGRRRISIRGGLAGVGCQRSWSLNRKCCYLRSLLAGRSRKSGLERHQSWNRVAQGSSQSLPRSARETPQGRRWRFDGSLRRADGSVRTGIQVVVREVQRSVDPSVSDRWSRSRKRVKAISKVRIVLRQCIQQQSQVEWVQVFSSHTGSRCVATAVC